MISVAIATYNGEKYIERQLESILNQTVSVDEVVICDDRSVDGTVDICRRFIEENSLDGWHININDENVGFCLNFYGAIKRCGGDIVFLADQDDEWHCDKVEKMLAAFDAHPEITVLSARYDVIDAESKIIENSGVTYLGEKFDGSLEEVTAESLIGCSYIRGFSIAFRGSLVPFIKDIDLKSLLAHDWLISMLGCVKGETAILNTTLTDYRYHGDNVSLSAMSGNFKRDIDKRIRGIKESVEGHSYILSLTDKKNLQKSISAFVSFEKKRLAFLESKNLLRWLFLGFFMGEYRRYYKGNALRVWLGDLAYAFKK